MSSNIRQRFATLVACASITIGSAVVLGPSVASATKPHTGCAVSVGTSSGWCGLYPGNATNNVKDVASVTMSGDGSLLTIATLSLDTNAPPRTSMSCISMVPLVVQTHRLQAEQCSAINGVWFTWSGASITIDLTQFPQFYGGNFSVQVGANKDAGNGNGDSFYNGFGVLGVLYT